MNALNNAAPAPQAAPPPTPVGARSVQRDAQASTDEQAAFERLMDRAHVADVASADELADAPGRSADRAARAARDRVGERSERRDTSLETADDAARATPPLAWALPYPLCGMASTIAPPAGSAATDTRPAWSELSAYLERLFVEGGTRPGGGPAAMFTLHADVLADTAVCLTRVAQGWSLRIDTRDRRLLVDARRHEAALRERFAHRGLGELTIELGEMPWAMG